MTKLKVSARTVPIGFTEEPVWRQRGWKQLFGSFAAEGLSFEWHDFESREEIDWASSFHPDSIELCLNVAGEGSVRDEKTEAIYGPLTSGFYCRADQPLRAVRRPHQRHQFLTVEFSFAYLKAHLAGSVLALHPLVGRCVEGQISGKSEIVGSSRLTTRLQHILQTLREPPVLAAAQSLWYHTKALELAAEFFFQAPGGEELFCQRQKRLASERVDKVIALLRRDLSNPPPLEDIGRATGCSPFHLSRTFSKETGMTIPQYVRQLRMDRAAELLRAGRMNVTEVALEVGYSSLSHFSQAFHQTFGCCPGLYPLETPAQRSLHR